MFFLKKNLTMSDDIKCTSNNIVDVTVLPSVSSTRDFDVRTYTASTSAIEFVEKKAPILYYTPSAPNTEIIAQTETAINKESGDPRFTAVNAMQYLQTRYTTLDDATTYDKLLQKTFTVTTCDAEGYPLTYTKLLSTVFYDQQNTVIKLPIYDKYGQIVTFPLKDENGRYLLKEAVSAIDYTQNIIHFPLRDTNSNYIKYPFKDALTIQQTNTQAQNVDSNVILTLPPRNADLLVSATTAYKELSVASDNAKDAHSFKFVNFLLNSEKIHPDKFLSFFFITLDNGLTCFGVAVYKTSTNITDISSLNFEYFIRYYPDRADYVYKLYKERGGTAPYTPITPKAASAAIDDIIKQDRTTRICRTLLTYTYWSESIKNILTYKSPNIATDPLHVVVKNNAGLSTNSSSNTPNTPNTQVLNTNNPTDVYREQLINAGGKVIINAAIASVFVVKYTEASINRITIAYENFKSGISVQVITNIPPDYFACRTSTAAAAAGITFDGIASNTLLLENGSADIISNTDVNRLYIHTVTCIMDRYIVVSTNNSVANVHTHPNIFPRWGTHTFLD